MYVQADVWPMRDRQVLTGTEGPQTTQAKWAVSLNLQPKFLPEVVSWFHLNQPILSCFLYETSAEERRLHFLNVHRTLAFYKSAEGETNQEIAQTVCLLIISAIVTNHLHTGFLNGFWGALRFAIGIASTPWVKSTFHKNASIDYGCTVQCVASRHVGQCIP